ncbi:hypothetical protein O4H49_18890 [Kiloniella laminariae]|uniref:Cation/multidrug efflux pump n=1 Tax=Kiloniella laminariae TaxID=454162 RepID=A0ABT4LP19_9PROT|nr:hypothetical protein [Kiloniella laminariae]MCZ4282859.1 hypothetical protein [Kiloniella laminariae]
MLLWLFRLIIIFAILTVIYIALSRYYRWDKKKELESQFKAAARDESEKEKFIAEGMVGYDRSLKKRLLLGVFALPLFIIFGLLFIANFM